eukprot:COSAG01_NODE_2641_length_7322_cov_115.896456_7_plen_67_part_00
MGEERCLGCVITIAAACFTPGHVERFDARCVCIVSIMIRTEDEMDRNLGESQSRARPTLKHAASRW